MMAFMNVVFLVLGLLGGAVAGFVVGMFKGRSVRNKLAAELDHLRMHLPALNLPK